MALALVLARQRSGTGALRSILSGHPGVIDADEILHPHLGQVGPLNFYRWQQGRPVATSDNVCANFQDFLDELCRRAELVLCDVKLNCLLSFAPAFRSPTLKPWILEQFLAREVPVVWLQRADLPSVWVSGALAARNHVWHTASMASVPHQTVAIDYWEMRNFIASSRDEDRLVRTWLAGYPRLFETEYTRLFDRDHGAKSEELAAVCRFLGLDPQRVGNPAIIKQSAWDLRSKVSNYDEIADLVADFGDA